MYYVVTFPYNPANETLDFDFASQVKIWEDNGQPFEILFGNGHGKNFFFMPYSGLKKFKVEEEGQIPYQKARQHKSMITTKKE